MKKLIKLFNLSIIAIILMALGSCSKTENAFNIIPENATAVLIFNGKTLSEKSGIASFSETETFKLLKEEVGEDEMEDFKLFEPVFNNTEESGLDFKKDFFFFTFKESDKNYYVFYVPVLDKEKFSAMVNNIRKTDKIKTEIATDGKFSYFQEDAEAPFMIWDDSRLLFLISKSDADYLSVSKKLFNTESSMSINKNKDFTEFAGKTKDISLWLNYAVIFNNMPPMQKIYFQSKLPYDMTGTIIHIYTDFQKGKIVSDYDVTMNEDMKKLMEEHSIIKDDFDKDLLGILNADPVINLSFAFNFKEYYSLMKDLMAENQSDTKLVEEQFKSQTGMTVDEALDELLGDLSFSLHRIAYEEVSKIDYKAYYESEGKGNIKDYRKTVKEPVYYFSGAVNLKSDKIFNLIMESIGSNAEKINNYYFINASTFNVYFGLFDNKLLITNDSILISEVSVNGKLDNSLKNTDVADKLGEFPLYMVINNKYDEFPEELKSQFKKDEQTAFVNMLSIYKKLEITGQSYYSAKFTVWLNDNSRNSLEVILKSFDENIETLAY